MTDAINRAYERIPTEWRAMALEIAKAELRSVVFARDPMAAVARRVADLEERQRVEEQGRAVRALARVLGAGTEPVAVQRGSRWSAGVSDCDAVGVGATRSLALAALADMLAAEVRQRMPDALDDDEARYTIALSVAGRL